MNEIKSFPAIADPPTPKRSTNYSASETAEIRTTAIKKAIGAQMDILTKSQTKTDLHDFEAVKRVTENYISRCGEAGICPNFEGLAASLGISRKWAYEYLRKHSKEKSAEYLNNARLAMASLRMSLAEARILDNATSIFILKNSSLGFVDKAEYAISEAEPSLEEEWSAEESRKRLERYLMDIPDEDFDQGKTDKPFNAEFIVDENSGGGTEP